MECLQVFMFGDQKWQRDRQVRSSFSAGPASLRSVTRASAALGPLAYGDDDEGIAMPNQKLPLRTNSAH
jgi:hypothetical protein